MTAPDFQRAAAIFLEVRRFPPDDRTALLDKRCGDDVGLRAAVERLLANDSRHDGEFHTLGVERVVGAAASEVFGELRPAGGPTSSLIGRRIGRYRLIRVVGEGGMGTVFEAEQDNPRRIVALKVIRAGVMSRTLLRRFEFEAQVLGRLQHPGIAQVYEAGTDDLGHGAQPFFAMEFVNGSPLNTHVRTARATTRQRLELLARICDAVEHAHQKGVIHRDLKSSNILVVGADDATGGQAMPKILDFGVARAVDADIQTTTLQTDVGQLIGTMAYMSPEQMSGDPAQIDTRSDVYAMGVIGYELLAEALPFDIRGKTIPEAVRTISDGEATPLSGVKRVFRGDVETIIAKAMEKDKTRRYQSAAALAADLRRYVNDEPIAARPPSRMYQFRKFARRNKAVVVGVAAVFVVLVAGIIGTSVSRANAVAEARKAGRINQFLQGMLAFLEPSDVKSHEVTLRQVLDDAASRIDKELGDEPEVAADVCRTVAEGYYQLSEFSEARALAQRSVDLFIATRPSTDPAIASGWEFLGNICFRLDDHAASEHAYRQALQLNRQRVGIAHAATLLNIRDIVHLLKLQGKDDAIEPLLNEALSAESRLPSTPSVQHAESLHTLADILATQHRVDEAEAYYKRSLDMYRTLAGDGEIHSDAIVLLRDYALMLELFQRWPEAEALDREAVVLCRQRYGNEHVETIMSLQGLLAKLRMGYKLDEAEAVARELSATARKLYGEGSDSVAIANVNLGTILRAKKQPADALPLFEEAVAIRRTLQPVNAVEMAKALGGQGTSLLDLGRYVEAEAPLRECLAIREQDLPAEHPSLAVVRNAIGALLTEQGRFEEAEPLLVSSWEILRNVPTAGPQMRSDCLNRLVRLYDRWGKPESAERYRAQLTASP